MKNLSTPVLGVCFTLFSLCSFAQNQKIPINEPDYNKAKLFNDLPDRINFDPANLVNLFDLKVGQPATIPLTQGFSLTGQVVSTSNGTNAASVVIKSTNRLGASFTFTKVIDAGNTVKYIGRIISLQHGDTYEVVVENNQYYLKKKGLYDLVNE
jgi:hypothetical protein